MVIISTCDFAFLIWYLNIVSHGDLLILKLPVKNGYMVAQELKACSSEVNCLGYRLRASPVHLV